MKPLIKRRLLHHLPKAKISGGNIHYNGDIEILSTLLHFHVAIVIRDYYGSLLKNFKKAEFVVTNFLKNRKNKCCLKGMNTILCLQN